MLPGFFFFFLPLICINLRVSQLFKALSAVNSTIPHMSLSLSSHREWTENASSALHQWTRTVSQRPRSEVGGLIPGCLIVLITTRMSDNAGDNSIFIRFRGCLYVQICKCYQKKKITKNNIKQRMWWNCYKINMCNSVIKLVKQPMNVIFVIIYVTLKMSFSATIKACFSLWYMKCNTCECTHLILNLFV